MEEFCPEFPEFIDNVLLQDFNTCEEKWWQRHILGKVISREETSIHLVAGGAFAKGLEVVRKSFYYEGKSANASIEAGRIALDKAYGEERQGEMKSKEKLLQVLSFYFDNWPLSKEQGVIPLADGVERTFSIDLPVLHPVTGNPIVYAGRIDLIGEVTEEDYIMEDMPTKYTCGVDEKTTRFIDKNWVYSWDITGQFIGYIWACRHLGMKVDEWRVRGIALGRKEFDSTVDFKEVPVRPNDAMVAQWYNDMLTGIERMIHVWKTKNARRVYGAGCHQYFSDCSYMRQCQNVQGVPEYKQIRWNPNNKDD